MEIIPELLKEMSVFLVFAYLFSKTPAFKPVASGTLNRNDKLTLYFIFSGISIIGTYFGIPVSDAIANNRAIGAVLAGFIGGPFLGLSVGLTAGLHRFYLGGFTDVACGISTATEGVIGGLFHLYFLRHDKEEYIFSPQVAFLATFIAECTQMIIILMVAKPFTEALALVRIIALPMIVSNSFGAALIISVFRDRKNSYDRIGSYFAERALKIARRTLNKLNKAFSIGGNDSFSSEIINDICRIIQEETGVAAVAITDREKVLSFIGEGSDHHHSGSAISSAFTFKAINNNEIIFMDGSQEKYKCSVSEHCQLGSILVVPISVKNKVIGTIKLYETKKKRFLNINRALGEGISELLASQLLAARYEQQQNLLTKAELKLLQAQINPHFLFNALNTILAVSKVEPDKSRELLTHLSNFFRKNLKRGAEFSTISEELDHVNSYMEIEMARFKERLSLTYEVDEQLLQVKVPTFTLQPIVENAIKHGTSQILDKGKIVIRILKKDGDNIIEVQDNAGNYREKPEGKGLGLKIVDKRIKNFAGSQYGVEMDSIPGESTVVRINLPGQKSL